MDKAFISWLNQSISYEVFASQDGALRKLFNTPVTILCFIQGRKTYVLTLAGEQILSNRVIYINGIDKPTGMSVRDRITYQGIEWPILGYAELFDEKGTLDHIEVYV